MNKLLSMTFLLTLPLSAMAASTVQFHSVAGQHPMKCTGNFGQSGLLVKTGYTDEELKKGIPCEAADFDGNGTNDIWVSKCDTNLKCPATVVLMKKNEVLKAVAVQPETLMTVLFLGPGTSHLYLKDLGCKFPKKGALVQVGEGDGSANIIYTLKADSSGFVKFSECHNVESVD